MNNSNEVIACPYCGKEILAVAKKCKHCGEWLEQPQTQHREPQPKQSQLQCHERQKKRNFFSYNFLDIIQKQYADFNGSMGRKRYWCFVLINTGLFCVATTLDSIFGTNFKMEIYPEIETSLRYGWIWLIAYLGLLLPCLSAMVRRLHDIGKSGWWILISLVPLIGCIWLFVLLVKKGEHCEEWLNQTASDLSEQQENVMKRNTVQNTNSSLNSKPWVIISIIGGVIIVALLGFFFLKNNEYYLISGAQWTPNSDFSQYIAIVSDDKNDSYPAGKGWMGDLMLAVSNGGNGKISPILSSDKICRSKEFQELTNLSPKQGFGIIYSFYPSNQLPNIVYFAYAPMYSDGSEDFSIYGKIDIHTKDFTLYPGNLWGIISKGRFANSYLCERDKLMYIYPQSKSKEMEEPIVTFKLSDYMQYEEANLYDPAFQEEAIQWLENQ